MGILNGRAGCFAARHGGSRPGAERAADTMRDFSSAFYTPAFRWLWIQNFVASIGGTFSGYFFFYWMQVMLVLRVACRVSLLLRVPC